jgi:hypothetical protein
MSQAFDPVTCMPQLSLMAAATRVLNVGYHPVRLFTPGQTRCHCICETKLTVCRRLALLGGLYFYDAMPIGSCTTSRIRAGGTTISTNPVATS